MDGRGSVWEGQGKQESMRRSDGVTSEREERGKAKGMKPKRKKAKLCEEKAERVKQNEGKAARSEMRWGRDEGSGLSRWRSRRKGARGGQGVGRGCIWRESGRERRLHRDSQ